MENYLIGTRSRTAMKIPFILLVFSLLVVSASAVMDEYVEKNIMGGDYAHWDLAPSAYLLCRDACISDSECTAVTYQYPAFTGTGTGNCWKKKGSSVTVANLFYQPATVIWLKREEPTTGWLTIQTNPVGAQIFLNGIAKNQVTNYRFDNIAAGTYNVRVSLAGYEDQSKTVTVAANMGHVEIWDLHPITPAAPTTGSLSITSSPSGAQVYVDNIYGWGKTPTTATDIAPGSHTVSLSLAGYNDISMPVTVTAGQTSNVNVPLQPATSSSGSLSISSTPSGAVVIVDGVSQGTTPTTVQGLAAGSHTVRVAMSGYSDYESTAAVTAGGTTPVTVSLSPLAAAPPAGSSGTAGSQTTSTGSGSIEVRSQPSGATITFDGSQKGVTPAKLTNVKVGSHEVALSLAGYPDWKQTVTVKNGETASVNAVMGTSTQTTGGQPAASGTGSLSVATTPEGAQVYVDGAFIGNSPTKTSGLSAGSHFLTFKKEGYLDLGVGVIITAGQTTEYSTSLVSNPAGVNKRTPGFATVLGILAIACIIAGRRLSHR